MCKHMCIYMYVMVPMPCWSSWSYVLGRLWHQLFGTLRLKTPPRFSRSPLGWSDRKKLQDTVSLKNPQSRGLRIHETNVFIYRHPRSIMLAAKSVPCSVPIPWGRGSSYPCFSPCFFSVGPLGLFCEVWGVVADGHSLFDACQWINSWVSFPKMRLSLFIHWVE